MKKEMINRNISRLERMIEIIKSMPKPIVKIERFDKGVPSIKVIAENEGGICLYQYTDSGSMSVNDTIKKLKMEGIDFEQL